MAAPWLLQAQSPLPRALGLKAAQGVGRSPPLQAHWSRGQARATGKKTSFCWQWVLNAPALLQVLAYGRSLHAHRTARRGVNQICLPSSGWQRMGKKTVHCLLLFLFSKRSNACLHSLPSCFGAGSQQVASSITTPFSLFDVYSVFICHVLLSSCTLSN